MKKFFGLIVCCSSLIISQQVKSQNNPSYLFQTIDISKFQGASFSLECWFFAERADNNSGSTLAVLNMVNGKPVKNIFGKFDMEDFKPGEWNRLTLSGKIDKRADALAVGAVFSGKARFVYDDMKLVVKGNATDTLLRNAGFEDPDMAPWKYAYIPQGANVSVTAQLAHSGRQALSIDANNVKSTAYGSNDSAGHYANINGNRIYYEVYGQGEPLLLLHGALGSIEAFSKQIPELSKHYQVIAVDTRGHGRSTADTTRLTYELYADDVYRLLNELKLDHANVLGWSDGGNTGLILATRHPEKVRKLAVMGAVLYNNKTSVPDWVNDTLRNQVKALELSSRESDKFVLRVKQCLLTEPNIDPQSLKAIKCPVLVMAGGQDVVKEEHTKLIAGSIAGAKLTIFKGATHEAPVEDPDSFNKAVLDFFR
jgi:pimeloyl-ACP methyl ester carboxylesterase